MRKNKKYSQNLPPVWNQPIDPKQGFDFHRRATKPLTVEEMGGAYMTAGLRDLQRVGDLIDLDQLRRDLDRWHNPSLQPGQSSRDFMSHNFGSAVWLNAHFLRARNWRDAFREIKKRKLYVYDCWGHIPGCADWENEGWNLVVSDETQNDLKEILGKHFIGWDNGENDGRWFWHVMRNCPAPATRQEAHRCFMGWFKPFYANLQNYVNSLCGLTFPHYLAQMDGSRLIGAEFIQALPSVPMWAAWVRGAARQYQMLWFAGISIWDFFGYKSFEADGFNNATPYPEHDIGKGNPGNQRGPDRGPSMSLLKRVWHLLFMYGVNIEALETAQFCRPARADQPPLPSPRKRRPANLPPPAQTEFLSPLGKMQLNATAFCMKHAQRRGVQYCPVGAMLDFYSGWAPPRHLYSDSFYTVWGGIPYQPGDHQIDLFFREMYPGYQDWPYYRHDKYCLTATPHGDIVDVLLSDARTEVLDRYPIVPVLGEISVHGELFQKLSGFVERGGTVIWTLPQLGKEALEFSGITGVEQEKRARQSCDSETGTVYSELPFKYSEVTVKDVDVLLETTNGQPLLISKRLAHGRILTGLVPFGMTERIPEAHPIVGADPQRDTTTLSFLERPLGSPYRFLRGFLEIIFGILEACNLVQVLADSDTGSDEKTRPGATGVQYLTNVTDRPDRLLVTLINNGLATTRLQLTAKAARITRVIDLLHDERPLSVADGKVSLTLFPGDWADCNMYILDIRLDRPVVRFIQR